MTSTIMMSVARKDFVQMLCRLQCRVLSLVSNLWSQIRDLPKDALRAASI